MKVDNVTKLFQTMAIITLEVNILKNRLATGENERKVLVKELDKERNFQKGYKYNVEIQRKNRADAKQKNKVFIKKLQDENEELKVAQHS